jgi:hypothetical protein
MIKSIRNIFFYFMIHQDQKMNPFNKKKPLVDWIGMNVIIDMAQGCLQMHSY